MATQSRSYFVTFACLVGLAFTDCQCKKAPTLVPTATCTDTDGGACGVDNKCGDHFSCVSGCCVYAARECMVESDCCPGQTCLANHHCFDQRQECPNGQSDCGDPGTDRVCLTYTSPEGGSDQVCGYAPCDANTPCSAGLDCFQGFCVASPPCAGSCSEGTVCIPQTNACWGYGSDKGCASTNCMPGYLPMLTNPANIWDSCNLPAVACQCDELPPLTSTDLGRYSSSTATSDGQLAVSMYDGEYGDLVVQYFDSTGTLQSQDYVDGVPSSGTIVAGPTGPRGGIADPGTDVGKYTSIATGKDGSLFVSYYDVTNHALKLAIRNPAKTWSTQTVDTGGNVGLYTSIAIDSSGNPAIAYFQQAGSTTSLACPTGLQAHPDLTTGVKLAHASSPTPSSASSWSISWVDCAPAAPPPCYECTSSQTCVSSTSTGVCAATATGCTGCTSSQVCANLGTGGGASCQSAYTSKPLADLPSGVGLFPSLAFNGSSAVIAYYDHTNGALKAATGTASFSPVVLDGNGIGTKSTDTGRYPSVAVDPSSHAISIAYHDAVSRQLLYLSGNTLATAHAIPTGTDIIDNGLASPTGDGPSYVGASVNLHYTAGGKLVASYQNSTAGDLKVAELGTGGWSVLKTVSTGSVGYFSHVTELSGQTKVYVTHAQIHTVLQQNHPITNNTVHVDTATP